MSRMTKSMLVAGVCLVMVLVALCLAIVTRPPVQRYGDFHVVMGTFSRAIVIAKSDRVAERCDEAALEQQRRVDALMSDYDPNSEIGLVNRRAYTEPVQVSAETFGVLKEAIRFSELSGGAFDVTIGPLKDLWHTAELTDVLPTDEAIAEARSKVGYEKLVLDDAARTVRFTAEGMKIDLGGIAKGYGIDASVEAMKEQGAVGGIVDIGGDVRCFGRPPRGQDTWRVGIQNPAAASGEPGADQILLVLKIRDRAVTTSGDYRRFTVVKGQKQSHIMDTRSGKGADQLVSVTIIAREAMTADALATAVNVLGLEKGLVLIEQVPDTEAILIPNTPEAEPIFSSGAKVYVE